LNYGTERKNLKTSRQNRFPTTAKQKNLKKGQEYRRLCINPAARQKETQEVALHRGIAAFFGTKSVDFARFSAKSVKFMPKLAP